MISNYNQVIKALTLQPLRVLFIDLSSKQWTAWIFNDWNHSEEGKWHNGTDQQNYKRLIELITRLKVNYLVYERAEIDKIPERGEQDGFIRYIRLTHFLVNYSHRQGIAGAVILPGEVNKYINHETDWCWRDPFNTNTRYCDRHKQEATADNNYCNWYPNKDIPIKDEVDARAMWEIWQRRHFYKDIEWLQERERIHHAKPRTEIRQNNQYEKDKWQRLGTERNNIITDKDNIQQKQEQKEVSNKIYTNNKNEAKTQ